MNGAAVAVDFGDKVVASARDDVEISNMDDAMVVDGVDGGGD